MHLVLPRGAIASPASTVWPRSGADQRGLRTVTQPTRLLHESFHPHSTLSQYRPLLRTHTFPRKPDPRLFPNSLRVTLDAHRAANEAALVRTVKGDDAFRDKGVRRPKIHYSRPTSEDSGNAPRTVPRLKRKRYAKEEQYDGEVRLPQGLWSRPTKPMPENTWPWLQYMEGDLATISDPYRRLDAEIRAFEKFLSPTVAENRLIMSIYQDITHTAGIAGHHGALIGSQSTGLARVLSDIDINIGAAGGFKSRTLGERGPSPGRPEARKKHLRLLYRAKAKIDERPDEYRFHLLTRTKVPILQGTHLPTGIKIEIQSTTDSLSSTEYTMNYLNEFPALRALHFIIKHSLHMRGLGMASEGGLGSYAILNMVVAILKLNDGQYDGLETGRPLLDFLEFYRAFPFDNKGISIEPIELFPKRSSDSSRPRHADRPTKSLEHHVLGRKLIDVRNKRQPYLMCLQDPANPSSDLGKAARRIKHIQATFEDSAAKIRRLMLQYNEAPFAEKPQSSLLDPLLGADYRVFLQQRYGLTMGESLEDVVQVPKARVRASR